MLKARKSVVLVAAILIFFNSLSFAAIQGDANKNGKLDLADAIIILQTLAGLRPVDASENGKLDLANAVIILRILAGLSPGDVQVSVTTANAASYDASPATVVFNVHPNTTFTYNIANFSAGDKLIFDDGTAVGLINYSGTDGVIDVNGSLNEQVVTIHLTGIAATSDAAIFGINSFNTIFGVGSLRPLQ